MLFNSYVFLLVFLPIVVVGFYGIGRLGNREAAIGWLVLTSLFFYGWWDPSNLILILVSMIGNYLLGRFILQCRQRSRAAWWATAIGIGLNLAALAYYKYTVFFVSNLGDLAGVEWAVPAIVLPLAISFFTFQQISYLADSYAGKASEHNFLHYCLFVTFFPQLIAGPIVHHGEMLPQFARRDLLTFSHENLAVGTTMFFIGLFKKVVLADGIAVYSTPVFDAAEDGATLTLLEAWGGALAYTFQIYFDFSGYSDMALGLSRMFGIVLPLNFDSPYKAFNIVDFWRRWHMTLSRFLRDYIYIPLGGNRNGLPRRYTNLMTVMLVGGLWHGAGWTFVVWGGLHGVYLVVNHGWHAIRDRVLGTGFVSSRWSRFIARLVTFIAVVLAWVFFRAESFDGALQVLRGMAGLNGIAVPQAFDVLLGRYPALNDIFGSAGVAFAATPYFYGIEQVLKLAGLLLVAWYLPNTQELLSGYRPALDRIAGSPFPGRLSQMRWQPSWSTACIAVCVALYTLSEMTGISEFLYFQF